MLSYRSKLSLALFQINQSHSICFSQAVEAVVNHAINKVFLYRGGDPGKPRVLLLASTGVAAININSNSIHLGLHILCRGKLLPLNSANEAELRNKYSEVELVIIDEISMVSFRSFYQIHKRLNEIFSPGKDIPFGGKSIVVCGDLHQLPPVNAKLAFIFNVIETMKGFISMDLWHKFKLAELDQVMRQDDDMFVNLFNKIRKVEIDQNSEHIIKSRFIDKNDPHYPGDVLHIFVENTPVTRRNKNQLKPIPGELVKIQAKD